MNWRRWLSFGVFVPAYTVLMMFIGTVVLWLVVVDSFDDFFTDLFNVLSDDEWWVQTAYPCGTKTFRRFKQSGKLRPV